MLCGLREPESQAWCHTALWQLAATEKSASFHMEDDTPLNILPKPRCRNFSCACYVCLDRFSSSV